MNGGRPAPEGNFGVAVRNGIVLSVLGFWMPFGIALWAGARWLV